MRVARLIAAWSGVRQMVIDNAVDHWRDRLHYYMKANYHHIEHLL